MVAGRVGKVGDLLRGQVTATPLVQRLKVDAVAGVARNPLLADGELQDRAEHSMVLSHGGAGHAGLAISATQACRSPCSGLCHVVRGQL